MKCSFLIVTLCLTWIANECQGYGTESHNYPHPVYGVPPPQRFRLRKPEVQRESASHTSVPVLKAVVRTLEPYGQNYEVKLSKAQEHINFQPGLPPPGHIGKLAVPAGNAYNGPKYLPPPPPPPAQPPAQPELYYPSITHQQFTPRHNPLLAAPPPPPPPPVSQPLPNQNNYEPFNTHPEESDNSVNGVPGNYISQSEAGQLDHYLEKQNPVGETRAYSRLISTCYQDGHCDQQQLGPGQVDAKHQHIVLSARARVQPISDKCRSLQSRGDISEQNSITSSDYGYGGGNSEPVSLYSASKKHRALLTLTPNRPPNRRLYPYTEAIIPRDPYN